MVRELLKHGVNVHVTDAFGRPAIAIAARRDDLAMLRVLRAASPSEADLRIARREAKKANAARALRLLGV